ncbi:hypothetical protein NDK43_06780 [Neobacillus pocheonensis]|uniref:Phage protein n=1 Tax=Neobacillus pocheonensis TaxID=363869 RepID=A0ABT0W9M2_9BACI|nr:hypothetical protein [Neobacillus pocheonensis]
MKIVEVRILKDFFCFDSAIGGHYLTNQVIRVYEEQANRFIDQGFAELVDENKK